jgi:3-dehydroquinate synthase
VKMASLGDERLFGALETSGEPIATGDETAWERGAVAEVVERCLWAKVETVLADERETRAGADGEVGRMALNLGHTVGHGLEAATGFGPLLHGEAVAYGLRAACRIGVALGVTPAPRAERIEALLDRLHLATAALEVDPAVVRAAMATDKKHVAGRLRWILPTAEGVVIRDDVPQALVDDAIASVVTGRASLTRPAVAGVAE